MGLPATTEKPEGKSLVELQDETETILKEGEKLFRMSFEWHWHAGAYLTEIKSRIVHGAWYPWIEKIGLNREKARVLMRLSEMQKAEFLRFVTIDAAMKSLQKSLPNPKPKPALNPKPEDSEPSPLEKAEIEIEGLRARADANEEELSEAKQQIDVMEKAGGDSAEGMVARSDYDKLNKEYLSARNKWARNKNKLDGIKKALLDGQTGDDILQDFFGKVRAV